MQDDGTLGHAIHQLIAVASSPYHVIENAIAEVNKRLHGHIKQHTSIANAAVSPPVAPEAAEIPVAAASPAGQPAITATTPATE